MIIYELHAIWAANRILRLFHLVLCPRARTTDEGDVYICGVVMNTLSAHDKKLKSIAEWSAAQAKVDEAG